MVNLQIIKDLAEKKNISIRNLAERVGLKENQIHVMCRTNSTKIDTLEKIAAALNVHVSEFFDDCPNGYTQITENNNQIHTEGNYSPASASGDVSVVVGDVVLAERVKSLEALVKEKDERISELKERINELKGK